MKTLAQASNYIYIDDEDVARTKEWVMNTQRPDGSFESVGRLINKDIQVRNTPHQYYIKCTL